MALKLITAPSAEPISIAEAKIHLRVDDDMTAEDALIDAMIIATRMHAETICRRAFVTQVWTLYLDQFPSPAMNISSANWYGPQWGVGPGPLSATRPDGKSGYEILLPMAPLQAVGSIKYLQDSDGAQITLANTEYLVDMASEPARLTPAFGKTWPGTRNQMNAVEITFTAGYGQPTDVPQGIKNWMLLRLGSMYEHREEQAILTRGKVEPLPFVDRLLDPFRVLGF